MIKTYTTEYRTLLCEFFSRVIESHKAYISHGELQMGIALDSDELAPNYKEMWLQYLDRQVADPNNTLLLYLEGDDIVGFVLFGITDDGALPYGVIFDLSVDPAYRGKRIGHQLLQQATESFKAKGIRDCYLESGVNNHSAHRFFEHHGFRQVSDIFRLKLPPLSK